MNTLKAIGNMHTIETFHGRRPAFVKHAKMSVSLQKL